MRGAGADAEGVRALVLIAVLVLGSASPVGAEAPTFSEGDVIGFDEIEKLRPFLPEPFWEHRDYFFFEGMQLEIGPTMADYSPPAAWQEASRELAGTARIGPDGSLENYATGRPFPGPIDCTGDPHAGVKTMWNFSYQWEGAGPTHASSTRTGTAVSSSHSTTRGGPSS